MADKRKKKGWRPRVEWNINPKERIHEDKDRDYIKHKAPKVAAPDQITDDILEEYEDLYEN